eukprot:CAMPEP_0178849364 /NCGR_PEP_ID=MMETSP0746-20121128/19894_1 /TAXON_ID=913974 /ORGANISM="Nitzschia punctata, Strain CCMP561" /LENGTH=154 /DNA_ID=CAMNT_0020514547 /DNA_START=18 /DNA_END=482 /DNA_ORIENTATION=+
MKLSLTHFLFFAASLLLLSPTATIAETCSADEEQCANPEVTTKEEDPNCPSRDLIIRCAGKHLDTNNNGKLDRSELESAIGSLPWYARGILQILGSVDKMMKKCDIDGDDAISMDYDMIHNKDQCLATCFKRKAFKNSFFVSFAFSAVVSDEEM